MSQKDWNHIHSELSKALSDFEKLSETAKPSMTAKKKVLFKEIKKQIAELDQSWPPAQGGL